MHLCYEGSGGHQSVKAPTRIPHWEKEKTIQYTDFSYFLAGFDVFFGGYMFKRPSHSLVNTAGAGDKFVELSVGSADRIIVYSDI